MSNSLALRKLPENIKREYHDQPSVSREILISIARADSLERQEMLWKLVKLRKLSVQRFRTENAGEPGAFSEVADVVRLVRRLGRKLRALDATQLPDDQNQLLRRALERAQRHVLRTLARDP